MRIHRRSFASVVVVAIGVVAGSSWFALPVSAALIHESATLGATGQVTGTTLNDSFFLGSKFSVAGTVDVTSIGGHLRHIAFDGNQLIFGAIIGLSSPTAFPTGIPFGAGDVIASTTFDPGAPSSDIVVPLAVTLSAGDYALVFGSGLFGAALIGLGVFARQPRRKEALA